MDHQRKTVAVDFDRTLAGKAAHPAIGRPISRGIQLLHRLKRKGYRVVIHTARNKKSRRDASRWLKGQGVTAPVTNIKPKEAIAFIDDRAIPWHSSTRVSTVMKRVRRMAKR